MLKFRPSKCEPAGWRGPFTLPKVPRLISTAPILLGWFLTVTTYVVTGLQPACGDQPLVERVSADSCFEPLSSCGTAPDLWIVNTRCAPRCTNLDEGFQHLDVSNYCSKTQGFESRSILDLIAVWPEQPTVVVVHGNGLKHDEAMENCWKLRSRLQASKVQCRIVLWSWASDMAVSRPLMRPVKLIRANIQTKYAYAEYQGYYIARMLSLVPRKSATTLLGHSMGATAIASALHLLAGGQVNNLCVDAANCDCTACTCVDFTQDPNVDPSGFRVVFWAAALDCDALYPGQRFDHAMNATSHLLSTINPNDALLRRWPKLNDTRNGALGVVGLHPYRLSSPQSNQTPEIQQLNLSSLLGRDHFFVSHVANEFVMQKFCEVAFQ